MCVCEAVRACVCTCGPVCLISADLHHFLRLPVNLCVHLLGTHVASAVCASIRCQIISPERSLLLTVTAAFA